MSALFRAADLLAAAGDAIIAADPAGEIVFWNPAAARIFGFSEAEAIGRSLDLIIPEPQRERHWQGYAHVMKTGVTRYAAGVLRVPALHRDGRRLSIAFTVALLRAADGSVTSIAAIVREETQRFEEERALRKRLAELEDAPE
jgi:PAS domain S-box-containing protein